MSCCPQLNLSTAASHVHMKGVCSVYAYLQYCKCSTCKYCASRLHQALGECTVTDLQ